MDAPFFLDLPFVESGPSVEIRYPRAPGYKRAGTSKAAAEAMTQIAGTLRERVLAVIKAKPSTADEVADRLGISTLAARPRLSELVKLQLIEKTDQRRRNASGLSACVWKAVKP